MFSQPARRRDATSNEKKPKGGTKLETTPPKEIEERDEEYGHVKDNDDDDSEYDSDYEELALTIAPATEDKVKMMQIMRMKRIKTQG